MQRVSSNFKWLSGKATAIKKAYLKSMYAFFAFAILVPTLSTGFLELYNSKLYSVSQTEKALLSSTSVKKDLIKTTEDAFTYNRREELKVPNGNDPKLQELLLSANKTDSTGKQPYQATLSKDPAKGITFGDAEGNRTFTITPEFGASTGRLDEDSRVVYPSSTTERSIYTFKKNGIKNDIVLTEAPSADPDTNGSKKTYSYSLSLGKDLEARQLPSGDIGIYSSDPSFYGNIQVGDQKSQELIDKARNNGVKNTLVFEIPRPFILDVNKKMNYEDVSFKLEPNQKDQTKPTLTLEVRNLKNQSYPLSIDPTITVTTTADFQTNTGDTGNIDFSTSGQITRGSIGSGALGNAWEYPTQFGTARGYQATVVANGFMYVIGGCSVGGCSSFLNNIQIGALSGTGTVNAWSSSTFNTARLGHSAIAYNNYLYIIGGQQPNSNTDCHTSASFFCSDVQYASINPTTGALGTWQYTYNNLSCATLAACAGGYSSIITAPALAAYKGYMYVSGGYNGSVIATVRYAVINSNGTLGSWTATTSMTNARTNHSLNYYNGYLYATGGTDLTNYYNTVIYAPVNSDGTIGTWAVSSNTFTTARAVHGGTIYGGYIYIAGGQNSLGEDLSDVQYAPINADGSVGGWGMSTSLPQTLRFANLTYHSGYMFVTGGLAGGAYSTLVISAQIGAGSPGWGVSAGSNFAATRSYHSTVAYNNYLYVIGGYDGGIYADVYYAPINANGSIGAWAATTSLPSGRYSASASVYNGYLYVVGGCTAGICTAFSDDIFYAVINSNGTIGTWNSYLPTGGTVTNFRGNGTIGTNGVGYRVHTFASSGTLDMKGVSLAVDYLVVGGGGSSADGASRYGGGGGGRVQSGTTTTSTNIVSTVGAAGAATSTSGGLVISSASGLTPANTSGGASGGSLFAGGTGNSGCGGGGGGANGAGGNYNLALCPSGGLYQSPGAGGSGTSSSITGTTYTYGGGGGGIAIWDGWFSSFISGDGGSGTSNCTSTYGCGGVYSGLFGQGAGTAGVSIFRYATPFTGRYGHTTFVSNGYLYVVGGRDSNGVKNDVYYALICTGSNSGTGGCGSTAGMLGTWVQNANSFTTSRYLHQTVSYNGYLYIIGGYDGASALSSIQYAQISSSGSVGVFSSLVSLPEARMGHAAVVSNGYVYVAGGTPDNANARSTILYARINVLGALQDWQTTSKLSSARWATGGAIYNGFMYITGGYSGSAFLQDTYYALIGTPVGRVGSTTQQLSAFTNARFDSATIAYNYYLYIIGGISGASTFYNDIQYCPINSNGSVGTCTQQTNAFTTARNGHTVLAYNNYLYIIGGADTSQAYNDIQYCPINSNGSVGTCTQQTNAFTTARWAHTSVVFGGNLYIIGGLNGTTNYNDIQYCPINSNGSVGTCTQQTNAFTTARRAHTSVLYRGNVYIIGGWNGTTNYNDIQYCPINSNGSVGTCIQQTNAFTTARREHSLVVINENLYIIGGWNGTTNYNDIQYCPINSNGSVDACTQQTNAFTTARFQHSSTYYNGLIYLIAGRDTAGTNYNDIQYLPVTSTSQSATFERTIDTGSTANTIGSFVILGTAPCAYNVKYATAGSTNIYGATTTVPFALPGTNIAVTASSARYLRVSISLDDSTCGTTSTITDIVVYYNDIPNAPTLSSPANNATNVNVLPKLILGSSDENPYQKYFRYKIDVCTTSNCSTILRTIDQTSSQTGWQGQSQANGTAYSAGGSIVEYAIHQYQATALTANTQYWWRGYAIDPEGSNTWSAASSISTFTTEATSRQNTIINGNTRINGGTVFY